MPPARLMVLIAAHVIAVALFDRRAGVEIDAERGARRARTRRRARRARCRRAGRRRSRGGSAREKCSTPPVCTTTGPATTAMRPPALLDVAHHRGDARDAAFDAALRGDLVAHEREAEAIALAELRRDADAVVPADDGSPPRTSRSLRHDGARRRRRRSRRPCAAARLRPTAAEADVRAVVGRRVEVVGHAAVLLRRLDERVALAHRVAAERGRAAAAARRATASSAR